MDNTQTQLNVLAAAALRPRPSLRTRTARVITHHPIGAIGAAILLVVILVAILAPVIAPYSPTAQLTKRLQPATSAHLLGTDDLGRDTLSRIIYGSRVSLYVGLVAVGLAVIIGVPIGMLAGFLGGSFDSVIMRFIDIMLAFPALVLAIVITGILGPSSTNAMLAIGVVYAPTYARMARGSVLSVKEELYIDAARVIGLQDGSIMWKHVLPNILAPLIVLTTLQMSTAILTEAGLSFLGLGTQPPQPSWGLMLSTGRKFMEISPGQTIWPGLAIVVTVLAFNFLGDGMRDALDPRLRQ